MVSKRLEHLMAGWGKNERKTKPRNSSLISLAASALTPNQLRTFLKSNLVVLPATSKAVRIRVINVPSVRNKKNKNKH